MRVEDLRSFGGSNRLIDLLLSTGIREFYPPQEEAIKRGLLFKETSFVISSPTASGKTLIAEILSLKLILEEAGKVLYIVPLRALARQKYEDFKKRYEGFGIKVLQSTGEYDSADPWLQHGDIIISTNEKVDSLLRHHASWISEIRLVVADEVHLIGDPNRGPTLEIVLTRLKEMNPSIRFLCLSATIKNSYELAEWLGGLLIESKWRPIPLKEGVYFKGAVRFNDGTIRWVERSSLSGEVTGKEVINIALETIRAGGQVLIFSNTRRAVEALAEKAGRILSGEISDEEKGFLEALSEEISHAGLSGEVIEPTRLSRRLAEAVKSGVAFHHAGLLSEQRRIIEDAFRENRIRLLVSTTTLAMGLNLPSRCVIIKDWKRYESGRGVEPISVMEIKQMSGRAGRPGYDREGEAIIIARSRREEDFVMENYIKGEPETITSHLGSESVLRFHILSSIAGLFTMKREEILNFLKHTFYGYKHDVAELLPVIERILHFLKNEGLILERSGYLRPTIFGKRVSELYIDPLTGVIFRDCLRSPKPKRLISLIHMVCHTPDMLILSVREKEVEELLDAYYKYEGELLVDTEDPIEEILSELKTALAISDWMDERSEDEICSKYGIGPGDLHTIVELCDWLLYSSEEIAKVFNLKNLVRPLSILRLRVTYGVKEELLGLITLKGIGRIRARSLFNAGFRTREDIKKSTVAELSKVPHIGKAIAESIKREVEGRNLL